MNFQDRKKPFFFLCDYIAPGRTRRVSRTGIRCNFHRVPDAANPKCSSIRAFLDEGSDTIHLLREAANCGIVSGYAGSCVTLFGTIGSSFWIPTHTLTFSIKYHDDYMAAGVPTFPAAYGDAFARMLIAISSILAAVSIGWASALIGLSAGYLRLVAVLTAGLLLLAFATFRIQSERTNFGLFRYASLYMLSAMIILAIQAF